VEVGSPWTIPVEPEVTARARAGHWSIFLTPTKPVPKEWLPEVRGKKVLCLASGGGQQGPILSAAGGQVTVFDNSPRQLNRDRFVADRDGLTLETVEGTMADLSVLVEGSYDLIVNPVSTCFIDEVKNVWKQCSRVLRAGGTMLTAFVNPVVYCFDLGLMDTAGRLEMKSKLPYSDMNALTEAEIEEWLNKGQPLEFSHTLQDLIGGQLEAGFVITGMYEDHDQPGPGAILNEYFEKYVAVRSSKMTR
jgi:SAM-dependent methyltransferase